MKRFAWFAVVVVCFPLGDACANDDPDAPPIYYHTAAVNDPVAKLQRRLESGQAKLDWRQRWGWLPAVLNELDIPTSSQTLVFSRTSLQATRISPRRPRALYFNDDVYVGYVQHGRVLEISSVDPVNGPIFYTIEQKQAPEPRFVRDGGECLACHDSHRTRDVPGLLVRSVYPDQRGHALLSLGSDTTDPTTPLADRYDGWYVTGETGGAEHRGNAIYDEESEEIEPVTLGETCNPDDYLIPHSDVVALMVLEHQSQMHNAITRASYEARRTAEYDKTWGELLEKPEGFVFDVSTRRLNRAADDLVAALLFSGEQRLAAPVRGSSSFTQQFAGGSNDPLRQFDLQTRLFRLPCSYLIESESFRALPESILTRVERRLAEILSGADESPEFSHLSTADRMEIAEVLKKSTEISLLEK